MTSRDSRLVAATVLGTILQLAMVLTGHAVPAIAAQFAVIGMTISFVAGLYYSAASQVASFTAARGGAIAGGACALIGILVSYSLGDVPVLILALGTASSTVTGLIGGLLGGVFSRRRATARAWR